MMNMTASNNYTETRSRIVRMALTHGGFPSNSECLTATIQLANGGLSQTEREFLLARLYGRLMPKKATVTKRIATRTTAGDWAWLASAVAPHIAEDRTFLLYIWAEGGTLWATNGRRFHIVESGDATEEGVYEPKSHTRLWSTSDIGAEGHPGPFPNWRSLLRPEEETSPLGMLKCEAFDLDSRRRLCLLTQRDTGGQVICGERDWLLATAGMSKDAHVSWLPPHAVEEGEVVNPATSILIVQDGNRTALLAMEKTARIPCALWSNSTRRAYEALEAAEARTEALEENANG